MNLSNKKITLMGLGVLGRGVNVARYLLKNGADLLITDLKSQSQLQQSIDQLAEYSSQIEYVLERHREKDFINTDIVIKAAGVPKDNQFISAAKKNGVEIKMDASWFCRLAGNNVTVIGVTGTKGKSSVSHLIYHILKSANYKVHLGGNIVGQATLPLLDVIKEGDYVVLELDSWQLQGFHDEKISPHISVFTNFMPDHLNYYSSMKEYYYDKSAIYKYQKKDDYLVLSESSYQAYRDYDIGGKPVAKTAIVKSSLLMKDWEYSQPGEHNRLNAAQAYQVAKFLGINDNIIKEALETFPGVKGRLELVRTINSVKFYNDTNATTPEASAASIKALSSLSPIVICGGMSKRFPSFTSLIDCLNDYAASAVLLPGGISEAIKSEIRIPFIEVSSMEGAVKKSYDLAQDYQSGAVLMSPAGSSFGMFKNEYDRGEQFNEAVENI